MCRSTFKVQQTYTIKQTCTHLYVLLMSNIYGNQAMAEEVVTDLLENIHQIDFGHVA